MEDISKVSSEGCDHVFHLMTFSVALVAPLAHALHNANVYTQVHFLGWHKLVR